MQKTENKIYKIIIADDHQLFREGIKKLIYNKPNLEVSGEASDGKELIDLLRNTACDLILLDLSMPNINGLAALDIIKKKYPSLKIIIVTMYHENGFFDQTIEKGADGFMLKTQMFSKLTEAVEIIMNGGHYYDALSINHDLDDEKMDNKILQNNINYFNNTFERDVTSAIKDNEFNVYYQPILSTSTNKITGVEALMRWYKNGQILSPQDFIERIEKTKQIIEIGKVILEKSLTQVKKWHDMGYSNLSVSVNFSSVQFQSPHIVKNIKDALERTNLCPKKLRIEITETLAMQNLNFTKKILGELRNLGVTILLDDFGCGHSSLRYLQHFPVHGLKIDRSFIESIDTNEVNRSLTEGIITIAKQLKLKTVAEGVENEKQLKVIKDKKCEEYQGFYFSKPLSAEEFETMLTEA